VRPAETTPGPERSERPRELEVDRIRVTEAVPPGSARLDLYGHLFGDELDALSSALDAMRSQPVADSVRTVSALGNVARLEDVL
jgi:hypothetical protein